MKLLYLFNPNHMNAFSRWKTIGERFLKIMAVFFMLECLIQPATLLAQHFSETIRETVRFQNPDDAENELKVFNIQGNVIIEGYDGDEVEVFAEKTIEARQQHYADLGRDEVQLIVEEEGSDILVYLDAPFIRVKKSGGEISYNINDWDDRYDFQFHITIKVPEHINIHASTINDGSVEVARVRGQKLTVSNVNGPVVLNGISGETDATTVNGNITAVYAENPSVDSKYQTVNGTIDVMYSDNLSADIRFKSLHGDLYTDFENLQYLKARVEANERGRRGGRSYHIDKFSPLRIGSGGPVFSFEILNGDVYIKKIKS